MIISENKWYFKTRVFICLFGFCFYKFLAVLFGHSSGLTKIENSSGKTCFELYTDARRSFYGKATRKAFIVPYNQCFYISIKTKTFISLAK